MELHRAIFNVVRSYRSLETHARACELSRDDPRCRAFLGGAEGRASLQFFTGAQMLRYSYTAQELHFSALNALGLPQSRLVPSWDAQSRTIKAVRLPVLARMATLFKKRCRASNTTAPGSSTTSSRTCFQIGSAGLGFHTWAISSVSSTPARGP